MKESIAGTIMIRIGGRPEVRFEELVGIMKVAAATIETYRRALGS